MTSPPRSPRALIEAVYAAINRGEPGALAPLLAEDVVLHRPASLPYGGPARGRDEVIRVFRAVAKYLGPDGLGVEGIVADGDLVVGVVRIRHLPSPTDGPDGGRGWPALECWRIEGGVVVAIDAYLWDTAAFLAGV